MRFFHRGVIFTPLLFLSLLIQPLTAVCDPSESVNQLMDAAEKGNLPQIQKLLQTGVKVDARDWNGATALIRATQQGQSDVATFLIEKGADLNAVENSNGAAALMFAVRKAENRKGKWTASMEAKYEIARTLIRSGADVNLRNKWGATALQWAADAGNVLMVEELIKAGADVNAGDDTGLTPLMVAANYEEEKYFKIVRALLHAKAEVNASNRAGQTALMKASMNHFKTHTIAALIEAGANVNARTVDGFTALMMACRTARAEVIKYLIDRGADPHAKTNDGRSVLDIAKEAGYAEALDALKAKGVTSK